MSVDKKNHNKLPQEQLHTPRQVSFSVNAMNQFEQAVVVHPEDNTGLRVVSVMEQRADLANKYARAISSDYKIEILNNTHTRVSKLSANPLNIKINVIL